MTALLMTGFPGFLGSALLGRLLDRRPEAHAVCLVQDRHLATARERLAEIEAAEPHLAGRVDLVVGDVTAPGLASPPRTSHCWRTSPRSGTSRPSTTSQSGRRSRTG